MRITNRERRDWTLIIFIIPIGIILMMIAGRIAVRIVPQWSVNADMESLLDPQIAPKQQVGFVQPVLPEILTPLGWFDTFLTPNSDSGSDIVFPPFVVFEPTSTPSPTTSPEPSPTVTETPTASASPSPSPSPTTVTTVPSATKTKDPDKTPKPPTATPPTATPPTATPPPITSTIDPSLTLVTPAPPDINVGAPDGIPGGVQPGNYVVMDISINPVVVTNPSETNYDLVYYEATNGTNVMLDSVILGISQLVDGSIYYEVFNWGDNNRDINTNVDTNTLPPDTGCVAPAAPECDNRVIPTTELHPDPGGTGILIDVDNAPSAPPAGRYDYIVIISPNTGNGDAAQVDAIEVTEVVPTP